MNWGGELPLDYQERRVYRGRRSVDPRTRPLLPRELMLLICLADGYSTADVAEELGYHERTIKLHIAELEQRYGARNRAHLVVLAVRAGDI